MAFRTTPEAVKKIIVTDENAWAEIDTAFMDPFIEVANNLVNNVVVPGGYDVMTLELTERYLAAHFYAVSDPAPRVTVEQVASLREQYSFKVNLGLDFTQWGQQAMRIEFKGLLAAMNESQKNLMVKRVGKVTWLGKEDS